MIRADGDATIAVKGRASSVVLESDLPGMRISNISEKGCSHLTMRQRVQVEFIMMSTKVVFISQILSREQSSIVVSLPTSLLSIERRKNARYPATPELTAFLDLSMWKPDEYDVTAPPFFAHHKDVASFIPVSDVSFGGLCAVTRFPAVNGVLRRGLIDDRAKLILPMQDPLDVGVEIRWVKRIKEHYRSGGGAEDSTRAFMRFYRFGVEFISQSDAVKLAVRQFIQQVSQAGAI